MSDEPGFMLPQQPQRQDSLADQLRTVHVLAARAGCYDAADWLWKRIDRSPDADADRIEALGAEAKRYETALLAHHDAAHRAWAIWACDICAEAFPDGGPCATCWGTGHEGDTSVMSGSQLPPCPDCKGSGRIQGGSLR